MKETSTQTTGALTVIRTFRMVGGYLAYTVLGQDGGLSWETYSTADEAKKDKMWKRGAKIAEVRLEVVETIEENNTPIPWWYELMEKPNDP